MKLATKPLQYMSYVLFLFYNVKIKYFLIDAYLLNIMTPFSAKTLSKQCNVSLFLIL